MIQNKMHKNGQILTINGHKYRIAKSPFNCGSCQSCDANNKYDCIDGPNSQDSIYCTRVIPLQSILKRIDNVKLK